jgi:uncharacterized protein
MSYVERFLSKKLDVLLDGPASDIGTILVEGARQVGKTTLIERVLEKCDARIIALNLEENPVIRLQIDECSNFKDFEDYLVNKHGFEINSDNILFIDEAQESQHLGRFVRFFKERWNGPRVILTGSTLHRLFRGDTRYPVGRVVVLHLNPFSFSEYLGAIKATVALEALNGNIDEISAGRHKILLEHLDKYLLTGGLPEIVLKNFRGDDIHELLEKMLADYIQDFYRLFDENSADLAIKCLKSVASFVGSPSKLTTVLGSDPNTKSRKEATTVFRRLEQWNLILNSEQFGPGPEASFGYHPKKYLFDTGILRYLRETSVPSIQLSKTLDSQQRRPLGGIIENQVAIAIKQITSSLSGWKQSSSGFEIDFVFKSRGQTIPIECKAALTIKTQHAKGVRSYLGKQGGSTGIIVSLAPFEIMNFDSNKTIINLPLYLVDRLLEIITI